MAVRSKYRPRKDDDRMSNPRPFDLSDKAEVKRLIGELRGYMRVSLNDGTDTEGRAHAYAALCELDTTGGLARAVDALQGKFDDLSDSQKQEWDHANGRGVNV